MAVHSYEKVLAEALGLSSEQQWTLIADLVHAAGRQPRRSISEFFGVLGPSSGDAQHKVDQLRSEWDQR